VNLCGPGVTAHTAVIAQSGSGKSFMLGRLLEEVASKTRARMILLDPNSDFVKFGTVNDGAWEQFRGNFADTDTRAAFESRWSTVGFDILSRRSLEAVGTPFSGNLSPISLAWSRTPFEKKLVYLGLSSEADPDVLRACNGIQASEAVYRDHGGGEYTLERWCEAATALWASAKGTAFQTPAGWPWVAFPNSMDILSAGAAANVASRLATLSRSGMWDIAGSVCVQEYVDKLIQDGGQRRVVCLDLGSLDTPEHRFVASAVALDSLWAGAREAWNKALAAPAERDSRCPVFIVIDEAHNLAPEAATSVYALPVIDTLTKIAMEGRKYGLFLIMVTQRPSRLNGNLLSQCDNLCLMKMSNPADAQLVEDRFGFVPRGSAAQTLDLKKGQAILAGQFVDQAVRAAVAPRRTLEGGRSLRDSVWLQDPLPAGDKAE
jgi:hypothetical protein